MIIIFGIKNCDTVKKARKALDAEGVAHRFHDFRTDGIDQAAIQGWLDELGLERVLNKRGTTWRNLDEATKDAVTADNAAALMAEHPTLIKRPVIDLGDRRLIGFAKADQEALWEHVRG